MSAAHDYAVQHADIFREQFKSLLRIPSVSTLPEHAGDVRRAADWLVEDMRRAGFERATRFDEAGRHPLVLGEWLGAGADAPTVLVYCHYDVQPAAVEDGWETEPFEPVERDGKIFARGAVDSKIHVMAHLKAAESLLATGNRPVNLKLLFEGEEESGSKHIETFIPEYRDDLKADVILVSDGSFPDPEQPVLVYALRGIVTTELTVTGPVRDLHSGHYGGSVHNPVQALIEILAQLHDADGRVTVPGFYDDVLPLEEDERAELSKILPVIEAEWQQVTEAPQPWGEPEYTIHERISARPTLEINGIAGGYAGQGFKTVLPAKASAKISCRLVANQDPHKVFAALRDMIAKITPPTVHAELRELEPGYPAALTDRYTPAIQAAVAAYERAWGRKPLFTREGGSIPIVTTLQRELKAPVVLMPFGYKGGRAHGPNEYILVDMFHKGIATTIHFYQELSTRG